MLMHCLANSVCNRQRRAADAIDASVAIAITLDTLATSPATGTTNNVS